MNMHMERMDLAPSEYIIQAELALGEHFILSLRFTTNRRVTKWLGTTHTLTYTHTHTHTHKHIHTRTHAHAHAHTHARTRLHTRI